MTIRGPAIAMIACLLGAAGAQADAPSPVQTLLARPLFNADRRPEARSAVAAATETPLPRLTGMIVAPEGKRALFVLDGRTVTAAEGHAVGAWTVGRIAGGVVRLSAQDREWTLSLTGGPAAPDLSLAAAALPALPFWSTPCGRSHSRDRLKTAAGDAPPAFPELCRAFVQAAEK